LQDLDVVSLAQVGQQQVNLRLRIELPGIEQMLQVMMVANLYRKLYSSLK